MAKELHGQECSSFCVDVAQAADLIMTGKVTVDMCAPHLAACHNLSIPAVKPILRRACADWAAGVL